MSCRWSYKPSEVAWPAAQSGRPTTSKAGTEASESRLHGTGLVDFGGRADEPAPAPSIMLAGIVFQLAVMVFYVVYMAWFAWKAKVEVRRAGRRIQIMLLGMFVASVGIIVRGVSQTVLVPDLRLRPGY